MTPIKNAKAIIDGSCTFDRPRRIGNRRLHARGRSGRPTTFFPLLASTWTFFPVPKHVIDEKAEEWVEAEQHRHQWSPSCMTEWTHDQQIVIEANTNYYGEAADDHRRRPTPSSPTRQCRHLLLTRPTNSTTAHRADRILSGSMRDATLADQILQVRAFQHATSWSATLRNAPTDKIAFRQALSKAIGRDDTGEHHLQG